MPISILVVNIIAKTILVLIWLLGAMNYIRQYKRIMNGAIVDFKTNTSRANRVDIIGAYAVFALGAIAMIAILAVIILY